MRRLFFLNARLSSARVNLTSRVWNKMNPPCWFQVEKCKPLFIMLRKKKTMLFLKVDTRVSNYIVYTYFIIKMFLNLTRVINLRFQTPHCNQIYRVCYLQVATSSTQWKINFKNKLYIGEKKRYLLKFWIV